MPEEPSQTPVIGGPPPFKAALNPPMDSAPGTFGPTPGETHPEENAQAPAVPIETEASTRPTSEPQEQ